MSSFKPTDEQERIFAHPPDRHARVLAGPGTGKSATLVALLDRLFSGEKPRTKLLTFTRAATAELAKKVADQPVAAARPSTIHSFAIATLLRNAGAGQFPKPLRIADPWEEKNVVFPSLARRARVPAKKLDDLFKELAANWESLKPAEHPRVDPKHRARFLGVWNEHRDVFGYTLLSELPWALKNALDEHPDLEGVDYELLIVDEYQDLNACDLEVLHLLSERGCAIIGAGDDDQSIYSFRRAAPEGIRRFPQDYPGAFDYPLSITHRCGSSIIEWASTVIEGDPDRPLDKPRLTPASGAPRGDVALLSFPSAQGEAKGVASLIQRLVEAEGIPPKEILVLLRGDHQSRFSKPIKEELDKLAIPYSDPDQVSRLLAEPDHRKALSLVRLLVDPEDSLAWGALLELTPGIGNGFHDYLYLRARTAPRARFGETLLAAHQDEYPDGPRGSTKRAQELVETVLKWRRELEFPAEMPDGGWGQWIIDLCGDAPIPSLSEELQDLLLGIDRTIEPESDLGRFLSQISPLGKDLAQAQSEGVRIMTMGMSKGLTVEATIVAALEDGIVPRPDQDLSEERRLLYVAMTRAKKFLYCTWARQRRGPTARAGAANVGFRRRLCPFLQGGVRSIDGPTFLASH